MAASQFSQNKRGMDEYLNNGLASSDSKRTDSGMIGYDSDLMASVEKIDNVDHDEKTDAVNEVEREMMLNAVIEFVEDEIVLNAQTDNYFKYEKDNTDQMISNKQGEITTEVNSEATSVTSDIAGDFTYYDDARADLDFLANEITSDEFGIIMQNYLDRDSVPHIMYSDALQGYVDSGDVTYGCFLWG